MYRDLFYCQVSTTSTSADKTLTDVFLRCSARRKHKTKLKKRNIAETLLLFSLLIASIFTFRFSRQASPVATLRHRVFPRFKQRSQGFLC
ncbi:hypothetical protein OBBRIDRAFT_116712 [Obba rivulosa]|uniref:Uncharacterized protein n=1 Tax=Obba rivulosa TaxID=1052685 RepID=A0A8E2ARG6_9APHY|nr:hypothetical protein OBBRIDRAFT_116712 [Obba rivulosa]